MHIGQKCLTLTLSCHTIQINQKLRTYHQIQINIFEPGLGSNKSYQGNQTHDGKSVT